MKKIFLFLFLVALYVPSKAQLFSQNFSSSSTVSDYVSATPSSGQFTSINNAANNPTSINAGALRFTKTGGSTGYFARTTAFTGPPTFVQIKFDFQVTGNPAVLNTNQATFYLGAGLTDNTSIANGDFHSRVTFNFDATVGNFSLRNVGTSTNGANSYSGKQTITFVVNNSGSTKTYTAPNGATESVANDKFDIWVGTTKEFDELAATTVTADLSKFKFLYPSGSENAVLDFDNFIISELITLPISLTSFTGKPVDKSILLNWSAASEDNNNYYSVRHSSDGRTFTAIGKLAGAGTSTTVKDYSFLDENPGVGTNYYQLVQHDFDGRTSTSNVISVDSKIAATSLSVYASSSVVKIKISSPNQTKGVVQLFDIVGRKLSESAVSLNKGYNSVSLPVSLKSGVHFVRYTTEGEVLHAKFMKQ